MEVIIGCVLVSAFGMMSVIALGKPPAEPKRLIHKQSLSHSHKEA
ncbi:hypothetical protein [Lyngbya aestuarii]